MTERTNWVAAMLDQQQRASRWVDAVGWNIVVSTFGYCWLEAA